MSAGEGQIFNTLPGPSLPQEVKVVVPAKGKGGGGGGTKNGEGGGGGNKAGGRAGLSLEIERLR